MPMLAGVRCRYVDDELWAYATPPEFTPLRLYLCRGAAATPAAVDPLATGSAAAGVMHASVCYSSRYKALIRPQLASSSGLGPPQGFGSQDTHMPYPIPPMLKHSGALRMRHEP